MAGGRRTAGGCGMQPRWWPRETRSGGGCPAGFRHCDTRSLPVGSEFQRASVWAASHGAARRTPTLRTLWRLLRLRPTPPCSSSAVAPPACSSPARCAAEASTASSSTRTTSRSAGTGRRSSTLGRCRSSRRSGSSTSSRRRGPHPGLPDPRRRRGARRDGLSPEPHALPVRHRAVRGPHRADPDPLPRGRGRRGRPVHAARGPRPAVRPGCRDARDARRAAGPHRVLGGRLRRVPQHRARRRRDRLRGQRSRRAVGGVRRRPGGMERRVGPRPGVLRRPAGHHHAPARTAGSGSTRGRSRASPISWRMREPSSTATRPASRSRTSTTPPASSATPGSPNASAPVGCCWPATPPTPARRARDTG